MHPTLVITCHWCDPVVMTAFLPSCQCRVHEAFLLKFGSAFYKFCPSYLDGNDEKLYLKFKKKMEIDDY
jgi:hypothetical protein